MSYQDTIRLGLETDVPIRSPMLRRWVIFNGGCPDCAYELTSSKRCNCCGNDFRDEIVETPKP